MAKKKTYNSKEREANIAAMQQHLDSLNLSIEYLLSVNKELKHIDANVATLEKYYFSQEWLDDYTNFNSEINYPILAQDPLFNSLQDLNQAKIKLLQTLAKNLK